LWTLQHSKNITVPVQHEDLDRGLCGEAFYSGEEHQQHPEGLRANSGLISFQVFDVRDIGMAAPPPSALAPFAALNVSDAFLSFYSRHRDVGTPSTTTPLHVAVLNGDRARIAALLASNRVDPRARDQVRSAQNLSFDDLVEVDRIGRTLQRFTTRRCLATSTSAPCSSPAEQTLLPSPMRMAALRCIRLHRAVMLPSRACCGLTGHPTPFSTRYCSPHTPRLAL